jgi:predicted N-formylglutamate amidohydrolase
MAPERRKDRPLGLVLSCEHASNAVPARWRGLFADDPGVLETHRGWDPGALELARKLARRSGAALHAGRVTRLLADLNRSPENRRALFSEWSRELPEPEREAILAQYYQPYRDAVRAAIEAELAAGRGVLHLSLHSFTPELRGELRNADVGLLYDPARERELAFAKSWRERLLALEPRLRVRRNYPYRGVDDGFMPWLRKRHGGSRYLAIELEVNQAWTLSGAWPGLQTSLVESYLNAAHEFGWR